MLPVWSAASAFRHCIALAPSDFPTEQVSRVTEQNDQAVGQSKQVAVLKPWDLFVDKGFALGAWLRVRGIVRIETILARTEGAIDPIIAPPTSCRVVSVA